MSEIYGGGTVDQSEKFVVRVDEESEEDLMANWLILISYGILVIEYKISLRVDIVK